MAVKLVSIVGARPQFIKAAVVSHALRSARASVAEVLVHTGQHYDDNMSAVFFRDLDIARPHYDLGVGSGSHAAQTGLMLQGVERVLLKEKPDSVLVYGDTNSTLAGTLAAVKLHIPVSHVEAGLRSFNRRMPEEINRVLTDHASDLLFAPTEGAVGNLLREGIRRDSIYLVGDVMYDAALYYTSKAEANSRVLSEMALAPRQYVLATVHRTGNVDDAARLRAIFEGLLSLAREIPVVLPLHPRTRRALECNGLLEKVRGHLQLVDPVGYLDMIVLEKHARLIVTDSGGVQKEAFFHNVPCVTLREQTEWTELVALGWNRLVAPAGGLAVASSLREALDASPPDHTATPYGDGHSGERIASIVLRGVGW